MHNNNVGNKSMKHERSGLYELVLTMLIIIHVIFIKHSYLHQSYMVIAILVTIPVSIFIINNLKKNETEQN